jgi:flagellar basal-body rod modification protein FlgD
MPEINTAVRSKYLEQDKSFSIQKHLDQLDKEEKSGLKGIEIREKSKELGKDDFLKILITQLSQQDPTSPMKDQEFIAQMAQFSSLEQMKNISSGISRMEAKQAYSVVGKIISGPDLVTGEDVVGIAGAIFFDAEGKTFVRVNGRTVDVEKINLISDPNLIDENQSKKTQGFVPQPAPPISNQSSVLKSSTPAELVESPSSSLSGQKNIEMDIPGYRPIGGGAKNNPYVDQVFIENDER